MVDPRYHLPNIPLEDLFTVQEFPDPVDEISLRWWNKETVADYLGVSERTVRKYKAEGKLECKYITVKGYKKPYYTNRSVVKLKRALVYGKTKKEETDTEKANLMDGIDLTGFTEEEVMKLEAISYLMSSF